MKGNLQKVKIFLLVLFVTGFGSGCNQNENQSTNQVNPINITKVHTSQPVNQSLSNSAKDHALQNVEVVDVKAVNTDKELVVAIKVENFDRFRLKEIEKKVKSELKELYPSKSIEVSTDQKIFLELEQLEEMLQKEKMKKKSLQKKIQKIKALMKEQA
jgi:hypothetical protein